VGDYQSASALDRDRLREITSNDEELMREIVTELIDDTSRHITLLESAVCEGDSQKCMRLAHYSKGACANVGANSVAAVLSQIENTARSGDLSTCRDSLMALAREIDRLKSQAVEV